LIIGIGGVSRSGKTTLARQLVTFYVGKNAVILNQDDYVMAGYQAPLIHGLLDWEHPGSIDFTRLRHDFFSIKPYVDVIIIEGLFAFYDEQITAHYDRKIYLQTDYPTFLERKRSDSRWGQTPEWYIEHIWSSHQKYGKPEDWFHCYVFNNLRDPIPEGLIQYLGIQIAVPVPL